MLAAMKYHARHLFDFSGRDARQTFWFWFLFLFILNIVAGIAMSAPMTVAAIATAVEGAHSGNMEAAHAAMMHDMAQGLRPMLIGGIILGLVNIALIAAAFVRRLHDTGKSAVWAALAGTIYLFSLWLSWAKADEVVALMNDLAAAGGPVDSYEVQARMGWENLLGYLPIILLIGFGLLKSDEGPNRYGDDPVRF